MDLVIIGAGAAGLICAGTASQLGHNVTVIEHNQRPARKLMITGKGRCNLTNNCDLQTLIANVPRNPRFLYSAFSAWTPQDTMQLVEKLGVPLKTERGNRVFPVSDKSVDIVDAFTKFGTKNCRMIQGSASKLDISDGRIAGVILKDSRKINADSVVICTGGMSYPKTGSTGDGYRLARQAGHTIVPPVPSLVPLTVKEPYCAEMMGLSLRNVGVKVLRDKKLIYEDFGELMFAHFGLTGPTMLSASAYIDKPDGCVVSIDMKPALTPEQLDARILRDFGKFSGRSFANSLVELLPSSMIPVIVRLSGIPPEKKVGQITKQQRAVLAALIKDLRFTVTGFRPIDEAIVTRGGVSTKEIDPSTMQSRLCGGLYFAGEVIDVDAYTGGFNLQIAFSTAVLAANSIH